MKLQQSLISIHFGVLQKDLQKTPKKDEKKYDHCHNCGKMITKVSEYTSLITFILTCVHAITVSTTVPLL